jgi:hypothetical protein
LIIECSLTSAILLSGKAITSNGGITLTEAHNHLGDPDNVQLKRIQGVVQKQALSSKAPPRGIIASALQGMPEYSTSLIRRSFVGRNIRKIRHVAKLEPPNPKSLEELKVSYFFQNM